MLRNSVKIHGTKNWTAVSTLVPGRNPKQCRERWTAQLDPALTRDDWTPQEDATLLHIHKLHGNAWAKIASFLPGRSSNAVKNRFNWLSRRHFPQAMNAIFVQPQPIQYNMPQMQFQMQMPRYNSLSPAQCGNFGFSDPSLELPPPRQAQSAAGSLTDNAIWDDYAPFQTSQSPIDELCGDFDWNMN
ncbi:Myb-like DNA-binding domain containing protein [Tritrichomonas foetus]|uniref:Myb-like DNA-binding domain containing protein n=1 Tax=Tritrichomonas foetus TaxID=1144522 RepID=A0A1J4JHF2_9EUKA|nr:Myb-like DNA-binding domain containing protein [Tritrichomonas foetus]|eukprot:OHS98566.1 Myb-like DNA-binding domain containing protein [Tritrichomonas foetus]